MINDNNSNIELIINKKIESYKEYITIKYNNASNEIEKKYRILLEDTLHEDHYQKVNKDLIESFYKQCEDKLNSEINRFCLNIKQNLNNELTILQ